MTTSRTTPSKWMWKDGDAGITASDIIRKPGGFYKVNRKGLLELIQCMVIEGPLVLSVVNQADGTYANTDNLTFVVEFAEAVDVTGTPQLMVTGDITVGLDYVSGTGTDTLTFTGPATGVADGPLVVETTLDLNSGTILSSVDSLVAVLSFPADYIQPAITIAT